MQKKASLICHRLVFTKYSWFFQGLFYWYLFSCCNASSEFSEVNPKVDSVFMKVARTGYNHSVKEVTELTTDQC